MNKFYYTIHPKGDSSWLIYRILINNKLYFHDIDDELRKSHFELDDSRLKEILQYE